MIKRKRRSLADTLREAATEQELQLRGTAEEIREIRNTPVSAPTNEPYSEPINAATQPLTLPEAQARWLERLQSPAQPGKHPLTHPQDNPETTPDAGVRLQPIRPQLYDQLTDKQKTVLHFLVLKRPQIIRYIDIAKLTGISEGSVRTIISRFKKLNILESRFARMGNCQGMKITLNEDVVRSLPFFKQTTPVTNPEHDPVTNPDGDKRTLEQPLEHSKKDRKNTSLSILEKLQKLTDDDIRFFYPSLHQAGFGVSQIHQVIDRLEKIDRPLDKIFQSLDHAEWELENDAMLDKNGNRVQDPCSYVFNSLARTGYYRRPKGYESPDERALKDQEEEARALQEAQRKKEMAAFEAWRGSLSQEEMDTITQNSYGPQEEWLKHYYRKHVADS